MKGYGSQAYLNDYIAQIIECSPETRGPAFTGIIDNRIIGCAGLVELTPYRAVAWALLDKTSRPIQFLKIHNAVRAFLDEQTYKRIDAQVALSNEAGHRWARALGFKVEMFARAWAGAVGETLTEYVRWGK